MRGFFIIMEENNVGGDDRMDSLTLREKQVGNLLTKGMMYQEIGDALGIGKTTVHFFAKRIYKKLHVKSKAELIIQYAPAFQKIQNETQIQSERQIKGRKHNEKASLAN